jgi:hypothetical protein
MARTATITGSLITLEGDPFEEGKDDFIEIDLLQANGEAIEDVAVTEITATLRSLDTAAVVNSRDAQDVLGANGGTLTDGTFRLDLSGDGDLEAVGSREMQARELTLLVTHSGGKVLPLVARFLVRAFADVG